MLEYLREYGLQLLFLAAVFVALVWVMNKTGGPGG
jgi:hypothetical protein